jgi:hypothetical protein
MHDLNSIYLDSIRWLIRTPMQKPFLYLRVAENIYFTALSAEKKKATNSLCQPTPSLPLYHWSKQIHSK